ncbi:hypothetical protein DFP73DRAFT_632126, partial [Morchella snyderi]
DTHKPSGSNGSSANPQVSSSSSSSSSSSTGTRQAAALPLPAPPKHIRVACNLPRARALRRGPDVQGASVRRNHQSLQAPRAHHLPRPRLRHPPPRLPAARRAPRRRHHNHRDALDNALQPPPVHPEQQPALLRARKLGAPCRARRGPEHRARRGHGAGHEGAGHARPPAAPLHGRLCGFRGAGGAAGDGAGEGRGGGGRRGRRVWGEGGGGGDIGGVEEGGRVGGGGGGEV